jgi:hypothetical protein
MLPGTDINTPKGKTSRKASPSETYNVKLAMYEVGLQGAILSCKYSEMTLANLHAS